MKAFLHNQNKEAIKNVQYFLVFIFVCIFVLFYMIFMQHFVTNQSRNKLQIMDKVKNLQKYIQSEKAMMWEHKRREFRNRFQNINEPIPASYEIEKTLSLLPIYQKNIEKVKLTRDQASLFEHKFK